MLKTLRHCLVATCLIAATAATAPGQPTSRLIVEQWSVEDGLPQNTVTSVAQDDTGYLWIATRKGLARFDGAQFSAISRVGDIDLGNLRLTAVLPDADGVLWVGTYGLGVLRLANGSATRYGAAEGVPHDVIWDLARDREGRVWLASSRGARFFDGTRWQAPTLPPDLAGDGVNAVYHARDGRMWLATSRHGVVCIEDGHTRVFSTADGMPATSATSLAETPDGAIWVATPRGAARIRGATVTRFGRAEGLPVDRVLQVLVDRRGVVWMATHGGGLVRHDGRKFEALGRADGLSTDYLISMAEDRGGALWVGTLSGGLNRLAPAARALIDVRSGLPPFPATTVYQSSTGTFWIGTYGGGLVSIDRGTLRTYTTADGLPSNAITTVAGGPRGAVWVGTSADGAVLFEPGRVLQRVGPEITGRSLRMIEVDHGSGDGTTVWFGGNGLVRWAHGQARRYDTGDGLRSTEVRVVYATPARVWVATYGGGLQSIERDGRIRSWGTAEGLTNPFLTSLHQDCNGTLWIGTYGGGLFRLRDGRFRQVTTRDGLPEDVVFDVIEDGAGRLWLTGSDGLAVIGMDEVQARMDGTGDLLAPIRYGHSEGVPGSDGTDGNQPLSWLAGDGRLWFATVGGVVIFDPADVGNAPAAPLPHIDAVRVDRRPLALGALATPLPGRNVEFAWSAPQLQGGRNVRYEYRLVGLQDAWTDAGAGRTASFTNLAPGEYAFEVRALAGRGSPPGATRSVPFTVPARFYEQVWFVALGVGALVLLVSGGVRLRVAHLRERERILEALVAERTAALQVEMAERERSERERRALDERIRQAQRLESLGDLAGAVARDFNNLLVGVLGEASLALGELPSDATARPHVEQIERAALRASRLSTQMLAYSGRGRFVNEPVTIHELTQEATARLRDGLPSHLTITTDLPPGLPLISGDRAQLQQVVLILLTNAVEAIGTGTGSIRIAAGTRRVDERDLTPEAGAPLALSPGDYVWLEVRDDGVGMDSETQARIFEPFFTTKSAGHGLSLPAVHGIVRSHGGRILLASQPGLGTTFTVLLPAARTGQQRVPPATPAPPASQPPSPAPPGAGPRLPAPGGTVLVIDDERLVRDVARVALRRAGFDVTEVSSGEEALAVFDATPDHFVLAVLDLTLPGIQGRAVMQAMRGRRGDLPVVLTSGYSAEEATDLTDMPRTVFLQKPWRPQQLVRAVQGLLVGAPATAPNA